MESICNEQQQQQLPTEADYGQIQEADSKYGVQEEDDAGNDAMHTSESDPEYVENDRPPYQGEATFPTPCVPPTGLHGTAGQLEVDMVDNRAHFHREMAAGARSPSRCFENRPPLPRKDANLPRIDSVGFVLPLCFSFVTGDRKEM
jgi:hypothetical protein